MNFIETHDMVSGQSIKINYQDQGEGKAVIFIHGWPLSQEMWEYQVTSMASKGIRCITYDRRGFGKSSKPWNGYNYDALSDDLKSIIDQLNLQEVVLVGFSMGGGEIARYFSRHNGANVSKVVLISSILPFLLKTENNPDGVDEKVFDEMVEKIEEDRIGFLDQFGKMFFGVNMINHPVSTPLLEYYRMLASLASPRATLQCALAFSQTDFRSEIHNINVPALIIHGDSDKTVPIEASSERIKSSIVDSRYIVYDGAPHGLFYTEKDRLNSDLTEFILA